MGDVFNARYIRVAKSRANQFQYRHFINAVQHRQELLAVSATLRDIYDAATAGEHLTPGQLRYAWRTLKTVECRRRRQQPGRRVYAADPDILPDQI